MTRRPTFEELQVWRGLIAGVRETAERPTLENLRLLKRLGLAAFKTVVPGGKGDAGRVRLFWKLQQAAEAFDPARKAEALMLARQVEIIVEASVGGED